MMFFKVSAFIFSLVVISESAFVDSLTKCGKDDSECLSKQFSTALDKMSDGVPEYNIPAIDPMVLQNIKMSLLGVDITLIDGLLKGLKRCTINKFILNIEARSAILNVTCNVIMEGTYEVFSDSPLIASILGGDQKSLHGKGDGIVKIKKLNIEMEFPFKVIKRGEDIFMVKKGNRIPFSFEVLGRLTISANDLYIGDKESSANIIKLLNENWKILVNSFGKEAMKTAMKRIQSVWTNFFDNVPCKHYLLDDLTSYVE